MYRTAGIVIVGILAVLWASACGDDHPQPSSSPVVRVIEVATPVQTDPSPSHTPTVTHTSTPEPTATPAPTATPTQTSTPEPTATPAPTATPTELPIALPTQVTPSIPFSMELSPGEANTLTHSTGARIVVPQGATTDSTTVSIEEVVPPESVLDVERIFDVSVTDASGEEVDLQRSVTIRLPYTISEGKNAADVAVIHWNDERQRWEAVDGAVVDESTQTVSVEVTDLSRFASVEFDTPLEFIAKSMLWLVGEELSNQYDAGFKHLASFYTREGFRVPFIPVLRVGKVGVSLVLDVDDLISLLQGSLNYPLPITGEGRDGYVTFWINADAALSAEASAQPPVGTSFSIPFTGRHPANRESHNMDPAFDATFSAMTVSLPTGSVSYLNVNENGNIHPLDAQIGTCTDCLKLEAGVSFAGVGFNLIKGEFNTKVLNEALTEFLRPDGDTCAEGQDTEPTGSVSQERFASELICSLLQRGGKAFQTIEDRAIAPFTSYEHVSPDGVATMDVAQFNRIVQIAGGHDVTGDGKPDMVFPHRDESGSRISNIPLTVLTTSDLYDDREYFLELRNQQDLKDAGWTIHPVGRSDDQYEFRGTAMSMNVTEWVVTTNDGARARVSALFRLVYNRPGFLALSLEERSFELWKDRELSDLSVEASVSPQQVQADASDTLTYRVTITNEGPDAASRVKLHLFHLMEKGLLLTDASTTYSSLNCENTLFVGLTCPLANLEAGGSIDVVLKFQVAASFPPGHDITVTFSVESATKDPTLENNSTKARTQVVDASSRRIAFSSNRDGNWEIYVMNADGSGVVTRLTDNEAIDYSPSWSPDGLRIAFESNRDGNRNIFVLNADGSGVVTRLTDHTSDDISPAWSPDGRRIAFQSYRDGNWNIFVMNADRSGVVTRLTDHTSDDISPAWSPDGRRIAFQSYRDGNWNIFVMNADGSGVVTRLTDHISNDVSPTWSPDGRIAFQSYRDENWEIYVMNADGSGVTRLTDNEAIDGGPSWSR